MARLLRRQPADSRLRPPAVVDAATVFGPVTVRLADQQTLQQTSRRPHPKLFPPAVIGAAVSAFLPSPLAVKCVRRPAKAHHAKSILRPPQKIGAAVVFNPVQVRLQKRPPRARFHTISWLHAPTVIGAGGVVAVVPRRTLLGVGV